MTLTRTRTFLAAALLLVVAAGCPTFKGQGNDDSPVAEARSNAGSSSRPEGYYKTEPGPDDPDAPEEFQQTSSGLKYRVLRKGGKKPRITDTVTVHYRGWLDNGKTFDSSYKRGEAIAFPLKGVVAGWGEGLQYVGEGGKIELEIPSDLGYGQQPQPGIPPGSTLHFIVELLKIK